MKIWVTVFCFLVIGLISGFLPFVLPTDIELNRTTMLVDPRFDIIGSSLVWADVDTLRPAGDAYSATNEWEANTGDRHDAIDEVTIDNDAIYIWEQLGGKDYAWYPEDFSSGNTIDTIICYLFARAVYGTYAKLEYGRMYNAEGAPAWCGTRDTIWLTTSYAKDSILWTQEPCTGLDWDSLYLNDNNYGFGYSSISHKDSFGLTSGNAVWNYATGWADVQRFQSPSDSGALVYIRTYSTDASGDADIKMAIYSDSSGWPRHKIWTDEVGISVDTGWNTVTTIQNILEPSTYYWLGNKQSVACSLKYYTGGPANSHRTRNDQPYGNAWPATWPTTGWDYTNTNQIMMLAILPQELRITQAYIVVKSHAEAPPAGNPRRNRILRMGEKR